MKRADGSVLGPGSFEGEITSDNSDDVGSRGYLFDGFLSDTRHTGRDALRRVLFVDEKAKVELGSTSSRSATADHPYDLNAIAVGEFGGLKIVSLYRLTI